MTAHLPPAGQNVPDDINVIIEIAAMGEPIKYEYDKVNLLLKVDRFLSTPMFYPANYGFIPSTLSEDGDPIDVLVVTPVPLRPGVMIRARPVGMLKMTDEAGIDTKIIAVPHDKLTPLYQQVKDVQDLPQLLLQQIKHFFEHYKDLEKGKWVKVESFENAAVAKEQIMASVKRYEETLK